VSAATLRTKASSGADGHLAADFAAAEKAGVDATPAFLVNDRRVTGVIPYAAFRALVLRTLSEATSR
jgi:protein-disulfide isomerase